MPTATLAAAPPHDAAASGRSLVVGSVMLATLMQAIDTTIANVALPAMQGSLSATQDQTAWVLTSYIVAAAIMTPVTGWLAGALGRRLERAGGEVGQFGVQQFGNGDARTPVLRAHAIRERTSCVGGAAWIRNGLEQTHGIELRWL